MGAPFQFHKGAIRTNGRRLHLVGAPFQFHKGAIRTLSGHIPFFGLPNFNSIKVRLEQGYWTHNNHIFNPNFNSIKVRLEPCISQNLLFVGGFQFHKGAIRTFYWVVIALMIKISIP